MLPTTLARQMGFCLTFALVGAGLGVFYDVLRAVRLCAHVRRRGTVLLDLLFCLTALFACLLTLLQCTDGRLRGYLGLGLAAGFFLYRKTLSLHLFRLLVRLLRLGGQALDRGGKALLWLFSFPRGN